MYSDNPREYWAPRLPPLRDRLDGTASTGQIHGMETVKAGRRPQVTRTDEVHLMDAIDAGTFQPRIGFAFGAIALGGRGNQSLTAQDAIDRTQGGKGMDRPGFHFPQNGLRPTEQLLRGQFLPDALYHLLNLLRSLSGMVVRTARVGFIPMGVIRLVSAYPFVEPTGRTAQGLTNGGYGLSRQIPGDGQLTTDLLFFFP